MDRTCPSPSLFSRVLCNLPAYFSPDWITLFFDLYQIIREVVELYLRREGYDVEVTADGAAALDAIERKLPGSCGKVMPTFPSSCSLPKATSPTALPDWNWARTIT